MKTPQLKAFDCIDHDPIEEWVPASNTDVDYSLCLHIGPPDEDGADIFYVDIVTSEALGQRQRRIVVAPYSWERVLEQIRSILERCAGDNWSQQSELLSKHFNWEFENYRPHAP